MSSSAAAISEFGNSSPGMGVRTPYLFVNDYVFDALDARNLRYDCSLEDGMSPGVTSANQFVFPYTADNGASSGWLYLSDTVKSIITHLKPHPGKWLIPAYPVFFIPQAEREQYNVSNPSYGNYGYGPKNQVNQGEGALGLSVDGKKASGMDYDLQNTLGLSSHEAAMTLLYNMKERYYGNRVPMTYVIHGRFKGYGLKEFIDSALTYSDVRFVTASQLIDWMESPVGLDGSGSVIIEDDDKKTDDDDKNPILNKVGTKRYGIIINKNPVTTTNSAEIKVKNQEQSQINLIVYDNLGSVVFETTGKSSETFVWNLKNKAGRFVGNGTYLVVAEAKSMGGKTYVYSAKLGIKREGIFPVF
jgi:hypothetical protein